MMDPKSIQSIWKAFQEVQETKNKKKEALDPVGKEDDDVDNDGDTDSSDEYLKKRRKAVGKSMDKDSEKDDKKDDVKEWSGKEGARRVAGGDKRKLKEEEKEECPKCEGEGCKHCDDKGYHVVQKEGDPVHMKLYGKGKMKESNLFSEEELSAIEEKSKQPNDNAGAPEPFMSTNSEGEKKFYGDHKKGSDKDLEDIEAESELDGQKASKAVKTQSPKRRGENRAGDIAMPTPKTHPGQVGKDLKAGV